MSEWSMIAPWRCSHGIPRMMSTPLSGRRRKETSALYCRSISMVVGFVLKEIGTVEPFGSRAAVGRSSGRVSSPRARARSEDMKTPWAPLSQSPSRVKDRPPGAVARTFHRMGLRSKSRRMGRSRATWFRRARARGSAWHRRRARVDVAPRSKVRRERGAW